MNQELTRQDYDLLLEAVEAWESRDAFAFFGQMTINAQAELMAGTNRDVVEANLKRMSEQRERDMKTRKERSVMLRSKLIALRDSQVAADFVASAQGEIRKANQTE